MDKSDRFNAHKKRNTVMAMNREIHFYLSVCEDEDAAQCQKEEIKASQAN